MVKPISILSLAALAAATPLLDTRASCVEGTQRICYGVDGGTSQNISVRDVQTAADYFRYVNSKNTGSAKFWNMPASTDCQEWTLPLPSGGTLLATAKHINLSINSSILYEDLATAIDGGVNSTASAKQAALYGCGSHGGQVGVKANLANSLYHTDDYKKSGAKPEGILIKLVTNTAT